MKLDTADAVVLRERVGLLRLEHRLAAAVGLDADPVYMDDLEHELATFEAAWVVAAVTDIACAHARRSGRLQG